MKVTPDLKEARLTVSAAAELAQMHPAHFRRLCRRGVFPKPRKTARGRPYFDFELLTKVAQVLKTGIGANGDEVCFYTKRHTARSRRQRRSHEQPDRYITDLTKGLSQIGVPKDQLTRTTLKTHLAQEFGTERPDLATAIAALARRLLG
jgi:hypothetical protein